MDRPPAPVSPTEELIRFSFGHPTGASAGSVSNLFFVKTIVLPAPTPVTLVSKGAAWKYYDTVTNSVAGWAATNFNCPIRAGLFLTCFMS